MVFTNPSVLFKETVLFKTVIPYCYIGAFSVNIQVSDWLTYNEPYWAHTYTKGSHITSFYI